MIKTKEELNEKEIEDVNGGFETETVTYYYFNAGDCFKRNKIVYKVKRNEIKASANDRIDVYFKAEIAKSFADGQVLARLLAPFEYIGKDIF